MTSIMQQGKITHIRVIILKKNQFLQESCAFLNLSTMKPHLTHLAETLDLDFLDISWAALA